jgi:hypothetical protein
MELELSPGQACDIARLRRLWPGADVRAHQRPWGVIVEVRHGGRTVSLTAFDGGGGVSADARLPFAA